MMKLVESTFRKGPIGALMDEYERASEEFKKRINDLPQELFTKTYDAETKDKDCRSVQTIVTHVVNSGYAYANYISKKFEVPNPGKPSQINTQTPRDTCYELDKMLKHTEIVLTPIWDITDKEVMENIIHARWGQNFDLEQILEHAIVHILRHRRQIERFLLQGAI